MEKSSQSQGIPDWHDYETAEAVNRYVGLGTMNRIVPIMLGVLFAVLLALAVWLFADLPLF